MANEGPIVLPYSFKANSDLSTKQFYLMKLISSGTPGTQALVDVCAAVTDVPIGVLQNDPVAGQVAQILVVGVTKVVASAALVAGNQIGTTTAGTAAAYVSGTDTTKYNVGTVLNGNTTALGIVTAAVDCTAPSRFS